MADLDVLVLGGGCAGLGLALRLAEAGPHAPRTHVLERRERYRDDRTWCFWRTRPHRFDPLVSASWDAMTIGSRDRATRHDCGATPYQMLSAAAYYDHVLERLEGTPRVSLDLGAAVEGDPEFDGERWVVRAGHGTFTARHVVDTRPPAEAPECVLWQSFLGHVVRAEEPSFDPGVVTLMDFEPASPQHVQFTYVLPLSDSEALVETTVFGPHALGEAALSEDLERAIGRRTGGAPWSVQRAEHGALPMGLASPLPAVPWTRAGLFHGGARPSTGYAFQRIQAWAEACAGALRSGRAPHAVTPDPALRRAMDDVFLRVLRAEPERGPELLQRLFERASTERVIRFLSDAGSAVDALAVVRSLPPGPFLRGAGAALLRRPYQEVG